MQSFHDKLSRSKVKQLKLLSIWQWALLALSFLTLPVLASDWQEDGTPSSDLPKELSGKSSSAEKFFLRGSVQHSEKLSPLSSGLESGAHFDPKLVLSDSKYASKWFQIPDWFAGTFRSSQSTIDFVKDYASGKELKTRKSFASYAEEFHGYQKDSKGRIWHFYTESGTSKSEQPNQLNYNIIDWYGPVLLSSKQVVMRIVSTTLVVDKHTGTIVDSYKREDIKTYEPSGDLAIKVKYSSKSFDSYGRPRDLQEGSSEYAKVQDFQALDRDSAHDYKRLFQDFLAENEARAGSKEKAR